MVGIIFAMEEEAKPYIEKYLWKRAKDDFGWQYYAGEFEDEECLVIICGVGFVNAAIAATDLAHLVDRIINIGSC